MEHKVVVEDFVAGNERAVIEIGFDGALVEVGVVDFLTEMEPED